MKPIKYILLLCLLVFAGSFSGLAQSDTLKPGLPDEEVLRFREELVFVVENNCPDDIKEIKATLWNNQPKPGDYLSYKEYWLAMYWTGEYAELYNSYQSNSDSIGQTTVFPSIYQDLRESTLFNYYEISQKLYEYDDFVQKITLENLLNTLIFEKPVIKTNTNKMSALYDDYSSQFNTPIYESTYRPSSSSGNLVADLFITTSDAIINSPERAYKSGKPLFLYDFGFSFVSSNSIFGIAGEFSPRINIKEGKEDFSVSIAANAGIGVIGTGGADPTNSSGTFSAELSAVSRFYHGFGAKHITQRKLGVFTGVGIGYSYLQYTQFHYQGYSQDFNKAFGMLCEGGLQFQIDEESSFYGMGLKLSYLLNGNKDYKNVFDLTLIISMI